MISAQAILTWENDGSSALEMFDDGRWTEIATVAGKAARKRHLECGRKYYFRVKPVSDDYDWSLASDVVRIPRSAPIMATYFGPELQNYRGDLVNTVTSLAGRIVAVYASATW